ncbi:hypothetical protein BV25DRAFT_1921275 [Artomyces pyxidatus]|uniref:Uncharacterized protein n=1 Tax=Artomyces pyxidatus TaxID=48021 RepID=A0ACB8SJT3_9AGAM|nr:hypothetical protein BV25DRAFT_1921275 [Artomyces pyxidatus]
MSTNVANRQQEQQYLHAIAVAGNAVMHYDPVNRALAVWYWPVDGGGQRVSPSDLSAYRHVSIVSEIIAISSDEEASPVEDRTRKITSRRVASESPEIVGVVERAPAKKRRLNKGKERKFASSSPELVEVVDTMRGHDETIPSIPISKLEALISCRICTSKMWLLYLLPECGHTFCQQCLLSRFSSIRTQHLEARLDCGNGERAGPYYTCPSCDVQVLTNPVESLALKRIVHLVSDSLGERPPQLTALLGCMGTWKEFFGQRDWAA